jgi:PKD repeat protein
MEMRFGDGTNSIEKNTTNTYSSAGNFTVNLTVSNINGTDSKLSKINVSAPVLPVFPGCTKTPVDPNNDGLYEDINGNERLDFSDVVTYYNNIAWITQNGPVAYFDYNKNVRIDFNDVVKLYNMH